MIFIDDIESLQYYNSPGEQLCYCESVSQASDVFLQSILTAGVGSYTAAIYVYSTDGLTNIETATAYFTVTFGLDPFNQRYFIAQLNTFSPAMCAQKCFIFRVVITATSAGVVFDKYTEVYCQTSCCQTATSVTFAQDGVVTTSGGTTSLTPIEATDACGNKIIRLISSFSCFDNFGNVPYTEGQYKSSSFKGRFVQRPAELTREISYNCNPQRSERAKTWALEGFEWFPAWKMSEIQDQLLAEFIYVDDGTTVRQMQFVGGTVFTKPSNCLEVFKLRATLQECTVRQTFGCAIPCAELTSYFVIPQQYNSGAFYSDNGTLIANTYDELLQWFNSQDGVTNVEDVDTSGLDCEVFGIAGVQGTALLPTSVYYDLVTQRNRVFAINQETLDGICGAVGASPCVKPVAGVTVITEISCATPVAGTTVIEDITPEVVTVTNYGQWDTDFAATDASRYLNQLTLNIKSVNSTAYVIAAGESITIVNTVVGTIGADGMPVTARTLNSTNTGTLTGDQSFTITPEGFIYFTGTVAATNTNEVTVEFTGLVYNINN